MRAFVFVSMLGLAGAALPTSKQSITCMVNGGEAASDATDAALFIWAATKRCAKPAEGVKCEVDVASAAKSVTSMMGIILKAVDGCGALNTANKACGFQAGQFTEHTAGIAAAVGEAVGKCNSSEAEDPLTSPVKCTVDLKNSAKAAFKAAKLISDGIDCKGNIHDCEADALNLAGAFAGMGQYISGTIGECNRTTLLNANANSTNSQPTLCAAAVSALVEYTTKISQDGLVLWKECAPKLTERMGAPPADHPPVIMVQTGRLYEGDDEEDKGSNMNLVLSALLPVTAIASFVGGRFYAARDHRMARVVDSVEEI